MKAFSAFALWDFCCGGLMGMHDARPDPKELKLKN